MTKKEILELAVKNTYSNAIRTHSDFIAKFSISTKEIHECEEKEKVISQIKNRIQKVEQDIVALVNKINTTISGLGTALQNNSFEKYFCLRMLSAKTSKFRYTENIKTIKDEINKAEQEIDDMKNKINTAVNGLGTALQDYTITPKNVDTVVAETNKVFTEFDKCINGPIDNLRDLTCVIIKTNDTSIPANEQLIKIENTLGKEIAEIISYYINFAGVINNKNFDGFMFQSEDVTMKTILRMLSAKTSKFRYTENIKTIKDEINKAEQEIDDMKNKINTAVNGLGTALQNYTITPTNVDTVVAETNKVFTEFTNVIVQLENMRMELKNKKVENEKYVNYKMFENEIRNSKDMINKLETDCKKYGKEWEAVVSIELSAYKTDEMKIVEKLENFMNHYLFKSVVDVPWDHYMW